MSQEIKYSILVVCLNAGQRLLDTIDSIISQTYQNYEIIIKDGESQDGSVELVKSRYTEYLSRIQIYSQRDSGIYDAMNQACAYAKGDYYLFLNTGDSFYDEFVLEKITLGIVDKQKELGKYPDIIYGNMYHKALDSVIYAAPQINDFTCYRNVPCHQTCFYHRNMFAERGYKPGYNVRADYEHFLWCYYEKKASIFYLPVMTASYEGGGYSETKEHRKQSAAQHKEITQHYMGKAKTWKYRLILLLTLAPLRSVLAENKYFSNIYNGLKTMIYKLQNKGDQDNKR